MLLQDALKVNGKVRLPEMKDDWIFYARPGTKEEFPYLGGYFEDSDGQTVVLSADSIMRDDWEPYKEPCKHQPWDLNIDKMIDGDFVLLTYTKRDGVMTTICKCGAKLKPTGWEVVE